MLTRYAEFAPISATRANTTSSSIRSRGPTALTYFFFGKGAGIDSTEFIVVDITNHPSQAHWKTSVPRPCRPCPINSTVGWFNHGEVDQLARCADQKGTKTHQSIQHRSL